MNLFSDHPIEEVRITGGFGADYGTYKHRGIDYSAVVGTPVYYRGHEPAFIFSAQDRGSFGVNVRLRLPEWEGEAEPRVQLWAIYAHLSSMKLIERKLIQPGELIGLSGNTGMSTAPHLHWQVYVGGPGASYDIALSRDPALMIGEPMPDHIHDPDAYSVELNAAMQMREDIRHYGDQLAMDAAHQRLIASGDYNGVKKQHARLKKEKLI